MAPDVFRPDAALLPLLPPEPDPFAGHVFFSAELSAKGWAVYHNPKPERLDNGSTRYGLRVPLLTVFDGIADPEAVAQRAAAILNLYWYEKVADDGR